MREENSTKYLGGEMQSLTSDVAFLIWLFLFILKSKCEFSERSPILEFSFSNKSYN